MLKTLRNLMNQEKEKFKIPHSVQQAIPVRRIWRDGIFLTGFHKYSKSFKFSDINYAVAALEDKKSMFLTYSELLNSLDSDATTKITIANRKLNRADFEKAILIPLKGDKLDMYRKEYNDMLVEKASDTNSMVQEKYITISVLKKNYEEAKSYFARIGSELSLHFNSLGSKCEEMDTEERLRILHDFYRTGEEAYFRFDLLETMRKGHSFKDFICPDTFAFESDHFKMAGSSGSDRYGRVIFLREFASYIKDSMIAKLTDFNRNLMLSIDVMPISAEEAMKEAEKRHLGVETNIANWQRRQNQNNNFSAIIPYDLEQQRKETKEFLDDLVTRDQRMMFAVLTMVHTAESLEQLNEDTDAILSLARKHLCQMSTLKYQQMDGLNTVIPIGHRKIHALRTLTTESLAVLMPFRVQEIMDFGGTYYGENAISQNMIFCNKANLLNPNTFVLGVPGSGKSFISKELITFLALSTDDDILVCDPEREYSPLIKALGGEVIQISAGSRDHINALDMVEGYGDADNPIIDKSEFVLSLIEQLDRSGVGAHEKSIIDRCVEGVYHDFSRTTNSPTLCDLRNKLLNQPEEKAKEIALALELFTSGSLDAFAHPTNVNVQSRILCYDIFSLGAQLKTMGLLVITDQMINRVTDNWRKGKRTHIFIDEFHVVFENEHSGVFFNSAWRRFRKRNAFPTAITQNVEYLLDSTLASTMLSNSEMILMLNQAASDREKLGELLNISNEQMGYITNADAGTGLIKYGSSLVPFVNKFPKSTNLYRLMSTRPNENF